MHSRREIWKMFNAISPTYDRVNRIMTGGIDRRWRKKMAAFLPQKENLSLLDCATGTGDQLFAILDRSPNITSAVGIDLADQMLKRAAAKLRDKPYAHKVKWERASASALPFADRTFDCLTISFGIRNVEDVAVTLKEFWRVLKDEGRLLILETSLPTNSLLRKLHLFYIRHVLPKLGGMISKNRSAYVYLNQTAETFPCGENFCSLLKEAGFKNIHAHPLMGGVVTIYAAEKKTTERT